MAQSKNTVTAAPVVVEPVVSPVLVPADKNTSSSILDFIKNKKQQKVGVEEDKEPQKVEAEVVTLRTDLDPA